jgi:hypothetical protein
MRTAEKVLFDKYRQPENTIDFWSAWRLLQYDRGKKIILGWIVLKYNYQRNNIHFCVIYTFLQLLDSLN